MKIEIWIDGFDSDAVETKSLISLLEVLFAEYIGDINLPLEALSRVLVADHEHFRQAIDSIEKGVEFTTNDFFVAGAKTFLHRSQNGDLSNSIVFRDFIFDELLRVRTSNGDLNILSDDAKFYQYVIYHELGHCHDNIVRLQFPETTIKNENGLFKVQQVAKYYSQILVGEFAACIFSAKAMGPTVYEMELLQTTSSIYSMLKHIRQETKNFSGDPEQLYNLAFSVSGTFWTILIQYSKLIGSKIGNQSLSPLELKLWEGGNKATSDTLALFDEQLINIWNSYPKWTNKTLQTLTPIWYSLALANEYKFTEGLEGDGIFW